jgi:hypothetical protein
MILPTEINREQCVYIFYAQCTALYPMMPGNIVASGWLFAGKEGELN